MGLFSKKILTESGLDSRAFEQLFDAYCNELRHYIYYKLGDSEIAEDIVQDAFLEIWEVRDTVRPETARALLYTINGLQLFLYIPTFQNNADPTTFKNQNRLRKILPSKFITGTGESVGVDFLLKYESSKFTSWVAYSRSKSIRNFKDINAGADIPAPFDKAHELKWTNLFSWKRWNFSSLWVYSTGQSYVSNQTVDRALTARFTYDRLPDYNRLDVAANYTIPIRKVSVRLGVSLINCLNKNNFNDIYSRDFNFDTTVFNETTYVRSMGITPNFFLNIQY